MARTIALGTRHATTSRTHWVARSLLAALLVFSGLSHLFWARKGYRVAVPDWVVSVAPIDKDAVVVASGAVEVVLGAALLGLPNERPRIGAVVAAFFVAVFPGNVHQWRTGQSAPLMHTDRARLTRLFLQPVLVAWALWVRSPGPAASRPGRA